MLRGEAGIGKTALLQHVAASAGTRVLHAEGAEAEMELPYAALHQLCAPLLDSIDALPAPQSEALHVAFGLRAGPQPDRFLIGLAVLTLLSDAAETGPVVCLVDDAHWLDQSSAQVLSFVARRLEAEGVLIVFAERDSLRTEELAGLEDLRLERLSDADARELLSAANLGSLDEQVRERIIEETRGNPLALLELPRALTPTSLAGGFAVAHSGPLQGRIEASFRTQVADLPDATQQLLLLGAAEPLGDPTLLWRAAAELKLDASAAVPAEAADLIALGTRVTFRHPLLRSAIYDAASPEQRRAAHRALASATDPELDPDRRAWHRAYAALAPDEDVAAELERSADRARARGGLAAAAAFLERAAELTPDPRLRAQRALGAARRKRLAGLLDAATALVTAAEQGPLDDRERALALTLRAHIKDDGGPGEGVSLLLEAARRLTPLDPALARDTYLEALFQAANAGRLGPGVLEPARAARQAPAPPGDPDAGDLLMDGLAVLFTDGHAAGVPLLRDGLALARGEDGREEHTMRTARIAARIAAELMDERAWEELAMRHVRNSREDGLLSVLPITLGYLAGLRIYEGDLTAAAILLDEAGAISHAAKAPAGDAMRLLLAAFQGDEAETRRRVERLEDLAARRGEGLMLTVCEYAAAVVHNSLGQYEAALDSARRASAADDLSVSWWALSELVEAGVRAGDRSTAGDALARLTERTQAARTAFARGIEAQARALLADDATAEDAYREAIEAFKETRLQMLLARAQLLYGEWLRRANRRTDSRAQLAAAHEFFTRVGADAFAGRAARELLATGATPRKRVDETRGQLTPQETQIATLARDGHTNPEIGAELFLSPRTVEWHLRKVFQKLDISSRRELRTALA